MPLYQIIANPTIDFALLVIALVALVHEWSDNRRRDLLCANCPVCRQRRAVERAREASERIDRLADGGRCPRCLSMLTPREDHGERVCVACDHRWRDGMR